MAVAASEVVVGLGLIVAMARRRLDLDVDKLTDAARMSVVAGAWICLLAPLAGALADHAARDAHLAPRRRRTSRTLSVAVASVGAAASRSSRCSAEDAGGARRSSRPPGRG